MEIREDKKIFPIFLVIAFMIFHKNHEQMNFLSISVKLTTYVVKKFYKNLFADHLRQLSFKIRSKDKFKKWAKFWTSDKKITIFF